VPYRCQERADSQIKGLFGLVSSHDWKSFKESIEGSCILACPADVVELSAKCSKGESIKVIYLAQHGHGESPSSFIHFQIISSGCDHVDNLGEHNIIHERYATWEQVSRPPSSSCTQLGSQRTTNKKAKKVHTPHDASLAPSGITEALEVSSALKREVGKGMPVPEKFFVSSLKRTGETCGLEWGWLFGSGVTAETGKAGWVEGEDRGCGIAATVIEVCHSPTHLTLGQRRRKGEF
jgi:hypothetical protein